MIQCKFNKKMHCSEISRNCRICPYFKNHTLDNSEIIDKNAYYFCPFCMSRTKLKDYFTYNKDDSISSLKKCPECNNKMTEYTLFHIVNMEIEEFAYWVFTYPKKEFWQRAKFKMFWENLSHLSLDKSFKEAYDKLKHTPSEYSEE